VQPQPRRVLVGAGGDPLVVGLIFFAIASRAPGMVLAGLPTSSQGAILPNLLMGAGLFQLVTAVWAILLGQSLVAGTQELYFISWACLFLLLVIPA
jgi:hypothetical protein